MTLRKIGRYEILSELGRGGMSTVYLAHDPRFERDVAVKLLPREFLHDPTFIARFSREAKTIASLEHAAIVPVYDFGEEEGQSYLVMRHMIGGSLIERLEQGPLSLEEISNIISRLATALDEAHERGMIHRDIKPGNILFDHHGDAFLTDFGIVKLTQETATYTGDGIIGTPAYMSPEQARGDRELDLRSDVYALGVIVFEMLSGNLPYEADTPIGVAIKHITEPIPNILDTRPDLQPGFGTLIERVLCKERDGRYATAGEFASALERNVKGERQVDTAEEIAPIEGEAVTSEETEIYEQEVVEFEETLVEEKEAVAPEDILVEEKEAITPEEFVVEEGEEPAPEAPIAPDMLVLEPEIESTVIESEIVEPEIREPIDPKILALESPAEEPRQEAIPTAGKKRLKIPVWGWAAGGVIIVGIVVVGLLTAGKDLFSTAEKSTPLSIALPTEPRVTRAIPTEPLPIPTATLPAVVGHDPSPLVGVFYYPWYGNPEINGHWNHWQEPDFDPPLDIASDYYPLLGAYSSFDPHTVAQHFAWLRQAGVGVIITSWWGQGSLEDEAVPLLLEMAEHYRLKVAFHIEPYEGRSSGRVVDDIQYLYRSYGDHPAFFRTTAPSRWSPDDRAKGLFFVFDVTQPSPEGENVGPEHWVDAMEAIHDLPDSGLVMAYSTKAFWINLGHFDGIYNYVTQHLAPGESFQWAHNVPSDAWYVPSVLPGFSNLRSGESTTEDVPRRDGATFEEQWRTALGFSVKPQMITITSFNKWHEGTQIEPANIGMSNDRGYTYSHYGEIGPQGYLELTRSLVDQFLEMVWPPTYRARIKMTTTSDWTTFSIVGGASWVRPSVVAANEEAKFAGMGMDLLRLEQPIERAEGGWVVELVIDILFTDMDPDGTLSFIIERGHIGWTQVELFNFNGSEPILIDSFYWGDVSDSPPNMKSFEIPTIKIISPAP